MRKKHESPLFVLIKVVLWPFKSFLRILLVVIIVGLYIYQAVLVDELNMDIRLLEIERAKLLHEKSTIQAKIDQLTNINRIEKLAMQKFDLINSGNHIEHMVIKRFEPEPKSDAKEIIQHAGVK